MSETSKTIYEKVWELVEELFNHTECLINISKDEFLTFCSQMETEVIDGFMREPGELDRHKLASVAAVAITAGENITKKNIESEKVFLTKFDIAVEIALSIVSDDLNAELKKYGLIDDFARIHLALPNPTVCTTPASSADARMLYWQEKHNVNYSIRVLTLANTLFLYEEFTLLLNDIDLDEWSACRQN